MGKPNGLGGAGGSWGVRIGFPKIKKQSEKKRTGYISRLDLGISFKEAPTITTKSTFSLLFICLFISSPVPDPSHPYRTEAKSEISEMFGRVRASPSSLDSLDGSPSKILKDDSFSIYEATLMKLKLGAKRDISEEEEVTTESSVREEAAMDTNCIPPTASASHGDGIASMETDCSVVTRSANTSFSEGSVSSVNSQQPRKSDASILRFFKIKDPGSGLDTLATKNCCSGLVSISSSGSVEISNCTSDMESD